MQKMAVYDYMIILLKHLNKLGLLTGLLIDVKLQSAECNVFTMAMQLVHMHQSIRARNNIYKHNHYRLKFMKFWLTKLSFYH